MGKHIALVNVKHQEVMKKKCLRSEIPM